MNVTPTRLLSLVALSCGLAWSQSAKFEVADVRVSPLTWDYHKRTIGGAFIDGDQLDLRRATMLDLIAIAWDVDQAKVLGGPVWLGMDRFDVRARAAAGTSREAMRQLLQTLLEDRFGLALHRDTRPLPAWALTSGRKLQIRKSEAAGNPACQAGKGTESAERSGASVPVIAFTCHNMTMTEFAARVASLPGGYLDDGAVVADRTGLTGAWDFTFKLTPRTAAGAGAHAVTLFDAIDQLGLRLEVATIPTGVVVVDRVNQKPTANSPDVAKAFPPAPTEFEVAVVKPSAPGERTLNGYVAANDTRIQYLPGGRVNAQGTLHGMIRWVWGINDVRLAGLPEFADADSWDIAAKAPGTVNDSDTLTEMLKTLLVTRFGLEYHTEQRPIMAYTLTAVKPKLKKADPASRTGCKEGPATPTRNDPRDANPLLSRLLTCTNTSMAQLAYLLFRGMASGYVASPVADGTGLEGGWDFTLNFSAPPGQLPKGDAGGGGAASDPSGTLSLAEAMEKQIGIRMGLQKRPDEVLVIDHLERKPTEN